MYGWMDRWMDKKQIKSGLKRFSAYICSLFETSLYGNQLTWLITVCVVHHIRFHDNSSTDISSTTLRLQTFRLQTFRLLLYTRVQDSYTSSFCSANHYFHQFQLLLTLWFPLSIPLPMTLWWYNIISKHCGMAIQLVLSVKDAYFYQSLF